MNKTGQILTIVPTKEGGYNSSGGGWINTFNMTIQCPEGQITGVIGTKSQQYPMNAGDTINVTVTNSQKGVKFKRFKDGYAPQPGQQQAPQGQQQPPQQARQATNAPAGNKDRLIVTQVVFKAMAAETLPVSEALLEAGVNMIMRVGSGQKPEQIPFDQFKQENPVSQDGPGPNEDDIPF